MNDKPKSKAASLPPIDAMSFEAALKELEGIVSRLEQGEVERGFDHIKQSAEMGEREGLELLKKISD